MSGYRIVALWTALQSPLLGAWVAGCKEAPKREAITVPSPPARGDRVVVEPRAAEFFEGRVLSVSSDELRVERLAGGEPMSVGLADVYRLPAPPVASARAGQLLVCRARSGWVGCQAEALEGSAIRVRTVAGEREVVPLDAVFAPSALTELNLKQRFARAEERSRFRGGVERAGAPLRPLGFRLLPRARVVARRKLHWYSGVVHEIEDEGAYVRFAAGGAPEFVRSDDIVPEPPSTTPPDRGAYALVRPLSPVDPWNPVLVLSATAQEYKVIDENDEERVVQQRDLLPLGAR